MKLEKAKLFIIFGATKGIGKSFYDYASRFEENHFILVNRQRLNFSKGNTKAILADLSKIFKTAQIKSILDINYKRYSDIILVANASTIQPLQPIGRPDVNLLIESIYTNFLNYTLVINEFLKKFSRIHGVNKKILVISSGAANSPHYGLAQYCSTKAAIEMFVRSVWLEQKKLKQAKILAFRPGVVDTRMQKIMRSASKYNFDAVALYQVLKKENKLSSPDKVAEKIYKVLRNKKYWNNPVLDINKVK